MRLILLFIFLSHIVHSQGNLFKSEVGYVFMNKEFQNYGFCVYDTAYNRTVESQKKISDLLLWHTELRNTRNLNKILSSTSNPIIDPLVKDEVVNIDSLISESRLKLSDYDVFTKTYSYLKDSIDVSLSLIEKYELSLKNVLFSIVLDKHKGIDYFNGMTYSNVVWYGRYGIQMIKLYSLGFSDNRPLYLGLVFYRKNMFGKIIQKEIQFTNQLK